MDRLKPRFIFCGSINSSSCEMVDKSSANTAANAARVVTVPEGGSARSRVRGGIAGGEGSPAASGSPSRATALKDNTTAPLINVVVTLQHFGPLLISALSCALFLLLFARQLSPWWFNPMWLTDDSLQQTYPFYKVLEPDLFQNDIITTMMERYLTPLHYWTMAFFTYASGDPIQAGHWVHFVQFILSVLGVFFAVQGLVGSTPAFFAVTWLVHTRHVMQRLTGGLPRGWALPVLAVVLCFMLRRKHGWVLLALGLGCLAHPPAAMLAAITYGTWLVISSVLPQLDETGNSSAALGVATMTQDSAPQSRLWLRRLLLLSPIYVFVTYFVVRMPPEIGVMADYNRALATPEFLEGGRFPFAPLLPATSELSTFGLQAFISRVVHPMFGLGPMVPWLVSLLLLGVVGAGLILRRKTIPLAGWIYFVAVLGVYELSRLFAFKLYVPNRHLQIPMAMFFILFLTIGLWRVVVGDQRSRWANWRGLFALATLGGFIYICSGSGIQGAMNFNVPKYRGGGVWQWLEQNSPRDAIIAGHPTFMDHTQLFAKRRVYVSTEVAHPFYDRYYAAIKPRIEVSLRAFYAKDLGELYDLVAPEGIAYFVFERRRFYPEELERASYFRPFDTLVSDLVARLTTTSAYREIPHEAGGEIPSYLVFRDRQAAVVDIAKLGDFLGRDGDPVNNSRGDAISDQQQDKSSAVSEGFW